MSREKQSGKPVDRPTQRPRKAVRKPGVWKGRVWIAPDFDELPEDLRKKFG